MVTAIGIDPHKATHWAVAVDGNGAVLAQLRVPARDAGHAELIGWARREFPDERLWAVEDERNMAGRLMRDLLAAGERVVTVPAHLAAQYRKSGRSRGKSDQIDATAVARTALRERLPEFTLDQACRDIKSLSDYRCALIGERTRTQNRLRDLLHQLDPDLAAAIPAGGLTRYVWLNKVRDRFQDERTVSVGILLELTQTCRDLTAKIKRLEKQLTELVTQVAQPLIDSPGCGNIAAAAIVGEVAGVRRFRDEAALAAYAGIAPLDASSGQNQHHRLNRGGNRRLNWAIHMIAISQLRVHQPARDYYQRRIRTGSTPKVALRALKRLIIRGVFQLLQQAAARTALTTPVT
jgi:transposase